MKPYYAGKNRATPTFGATVGVIPVCDQAGLAEGIWRDLDFLSGKVDQGSVRHRPGKDLAASR